MNDASPLRPLLSSVLLAAGFLFLLAGPPAIADGDPLSFSGSYDWNQGERGRLDVSFVPDGEGGWEVTFRFFFSRKNYSWKGEAVGDLEGSIEGTVDRGRGQKYRFAGAFEDGVFSGRHYQLSRSGKLIDTGTLTFR